MLSSSHLLRRLPNRERPPSTSTSSGTPRSLVWSPVRWCFQGFWEETWMEEILAKGSKHQVERRREMPCGNGLFERICHETVPSYYHFEALNREKNPAGLDSKAPRNQGNDLAYYMDIYDEGTGNSLRQRFTSDRRMIIRNHI